MFRKTGVALQDTLNGNWNGGYIMTIVTIYQNKKNKNKYLEIHNDGYYHNSVKQFMEWNNGVKNFTGDRILHRWRKADLMELLADYSLVGD